MPGEDAGPDIGPDQQPEVLPDTPVDNGGGGNTGGTEIVVIQWVSLPLSVNNLSPVKLKAGDSNVGRSVQLVDGGGKLLYFQGTEIITYRLRSVATGNAVFEGVGSFVASSIGIVLFVFTIGNPIPVGGSYYEEWLITDGSANQVTFPEFNYIAVTITDRLS